MKVTTAALPWSGMTSRLRASDVTVLTALGVLLRLTVQQLAGQSAVQTGRTLAAWTDVLAPQQADTLVDGLVDGLVGRLVLAEGAVNGWTFGLTGLVLALLLPVGGPVWAGLVPVGTTLRGLRRTGRRIVVTVRITAGWASGRIPATCNAPSRPVADDGVVGTSILIVDDSDTFRDLARRVLGRGGFDVVGAVATCAEALSGVAALHPQVVLVDVNLGAESGFEVARRLRGGDHEPRPAVLLMSSHGEAELAELIAQSPAVGFVPKEGLSGDAVRVALAASGR